MAFIPTKSMPMLFLLPLAAALVLLSFSHKILSQARVERELLLLFGVAVTPAIANVLRNAAARAGQKMAQKQGEQAVRKYFGTDALNGYKSGVKVDEVMDKMRKKAKEVCGAFCQYGEDCKLCGTNSQVPASGSCEPYCVMNWTEDTCVLPCGPPEEDNSGSSSSTSPGSINTLAVLGLVLLLALK